MADHAPTTVDLGVLLAHAIAIQGHVAQAIPSTPATDRHLRHAYGLLTQLADAIRDLRAAGRLLPEGGREEIEWGIGRLPGRVWPAGTEAEARAYAKTDTVNRAHRRRVTEWPDGAELVGPWEPVPDTTTEGATP